MKLYDYHRELNRATHDRYAKKLEDHYNNEILPKQKNIEELKKSIENESSPSERDRLQDNLADLNAQLRASERDYSTMQNSNHWVNGFRGYQHFNWANKFSKELNDDIDAKSIRDSKSFKTGQFIANHEKAIGTGTALSAGLLGNSLYNKKSKGND